MSNRHNRAGSKPGAGGVASRESEALSRKNRLRELAMETSDLSKDPYFMRNHLGTFECKLCSTLHSTEGNYLAHTQGKRHQANLARRAKREAQRAGIRDVCILGGGVVDRIAARKLPVRRIGQPGFRIERTQDSASGQRILRFEVDYPRIEEGVQPRHRLMSAYEQKVEPTDGKWQYLLIAALPYDTIGFKIPNEKIDRRPGKFSTSWSAGSKKFIIELQFEALSEGAEGVKQEGGGVEGSNISAIKGAPIEVLGGGSAR